ncbi:FHA domain-containing protein [Bifidobacterium sp. ESL0798]|uniref:FHA domain-containing protein n=1 Tax=Bifidobacterium sp. ESL0798 TaxID=2983235 RepID=UPI0023F8FAC5|nr:FHA domain-containing protein [Bifidobacterium sp. ESL0798]WEV74354.1 FHA domain-containing protein [Bifidobacterium sp. ESL0798]
MNMVYRGGRKVSDPRTTKHWVIKVNGSTKVDVGPGENVEIGRRPLRPLADDGHRRLEIDDDTRSMSKRHAVFTVAVNGGASVTDLSSTNGTYVVDEKGLRPLTPNQDFILPDSPMRLQFGDVPVDFVRVEVDESHEDGNQVTDLFDYAASDGGSADVEPDLNEMSVDDILNLRAGEPTTAFSAADVADRIEASAAARAQGNGNSPTPDDQAAKDAATSADDIAVETPSPTEAGTSQKPESPQTDHAIDQISLNVMTPDSQVEDAKARDLFKDAMESEAEDKDAEAIKSARPSATGNKSAKPSVAAATRPGESKSSRTGATVQQVSLPSRQKDEQISRDASRVQQPMNSPVATQGQANVDGGNVAGGNVAATQTQQARTGQAQQAQQLGQQQAQQQQQSQRVAAQQQAREVAQPQQQAQQPQQLSQQQQANQFGSVTGGQASGQTSADQDAPVFVAMDESPRQGGGARSRSNLIVSQEPQNDEAKREATEERNKFMPPIRDVADSPTFVQNPNASCGSFDMQQTFKPTFEPGSVFEKVSNGEFDQPQPEVEVGDMSSLEAKTTTDFSRQFEMAKQPELLPFLAMNPSLYDDLYAWLSAVGNDDVDAALSQNSGYIEYRNEVGEGRRQ